MSAAPATHTKRSLPPVLGWFLLASICLTVACFGIEAYCRSTVRWNYIPYNHFTLELWKDHADFTMFTSRFGEYHHPEFFGPDLGSPFLYPATVAVLYLPFYRILPPGHFLREILLFIFLIVIWFGRVLVRRGLAMSDAATFAAVAAATSYPLLFEIDRSNMEIFIWIIAALGVFAFLRNRPWLAATWIGLAGAFKFYPLIYLGLLIARKQYKQAAWSLVVAGIFSLFSLWALTGSVATSYARTSAGIADFRITYVLQKRFAEIGLDHSIFGLYKRFAPHLPPPDQLAHQLTFYLVTAAILACIAWFARGTRLPVLNQVMFLTIASIVLPPLSYDYTLLHLYTPFLLLVLFAIDAWKRDEPLPKGATAAFVCFTLLLSPLNEFILHGERISGQLKCLLLLALAAVALRYPFATDVSLSPAEPRP